MTRRMVLKFPPAAVCRAGEQGARGDVERLVMCSQQSKLEIMVAYIRVVFPELCQSVWAVDHQHHQGCFRNAASLAHEDITGSETAFNKIPGDLCTR